MANKLQPETMLMSGVTVDFPYKPYPCQVAMLARIIKALQQSKNCLLESPTGTGKTLTLLCAALSWQQKELEQNRLHASNDTAESTNNKPTPISRIFYCTRTHKQLEQVAKQLGSTIYKEKIRMTLLSSRDNYCIHPVVSKGPNKNHECTKLTRADRRISGDPALKSQCSYFERLRGRTANDFLRVGGSKQLPRVFDIEQFTEYCQTTHAICPYFTSRLLINDVQLILCPYNYLIDPRVRNSMQMTVNNAIIIIDEAHNIEDCARESMKFEMRKYDFEVALEELSANGKGLQMARIQAAQLLTTDTGFSFTQESSSSSSTQQQSTTRRVAGYSEYDQLHDEMNLLEHLNIDEQGNAQQMDEQPMDLDSQEIANELKFLTDRLSRILLWFESKDPREKYSFTPKQLVEQFHQAKFIDRSIINIHKRATKTHPATKRGVIQDVSRVRKALAKCALIPSDYVRLTDETRKFLEDFDLCLSILYADDYQFVDDYKIALKTIPFEPSANALAQMQTSSNDALEGQPSTQFRRVQKTLIRTTYPLHTQQLVFYCLSPSVAFAKDLKLARSLIFASGTLAPLATYAGELRIPFDIQLECNHVIDIQRTFITALSHGRNPNVKLRATYQNTDRLDFQDECGLVLLDICQRVPYGILCFVPSYRFLNVITTRWMASGLWQKLNEYKTVFFEEKNSASFQNTIDRYREANGTLQIVKPVSAAQKRVRAMFQRQKTADHQLPTSNSPYFPSKGGLLLAVCRGRASEGMDFSDNNARCVITLGIPYPNVQDEEVNFKRTYNNEQNKRLPHVMNGSDWYDSQAYRALNQALGRCIRHKNDWGALFIVDERVVNNLNDRNFNNKISLWIKQRLAISRGYDQTMNELEKFVANMKKSEEITAVSESIQVEQHEQAEKKFTDDEQRRFSFVVPPLIDVPKKAEETTTTNYRQWKVADLTDDEDDDVKVKKNHSEQTKSHAFEKFIAQRPTAMPPPMTIASEHTKSSPIQDIINLTDDETEDIIPKTHSAQVKSKFFNKSLTQQSRSSPPVPILSQKLNPSRTQKMIDLTEDDDFIESSSSSSLSFRPVKKLKTT